MTQRSSRKLGFQLVSLFDLLMIVIFAQYMDVGQKARQQAAESREAIEAAQRALRDMEQQRAGEQQFLKHGKEIRDLLDRKLQQALLDNITLRETAERTQQDLTSELQQSREDLIRLGALVARMFDIPANQLKTILNARTPEEEQQLREELQRMASRNAADIVRHLLTVTELEKRCDIWEIQIGTDNVAQLTVDDRKFRFRAETAGKFESELFGFYKTLPQPKTLVLILLSWSDCDFGPRKAAVTGLPAAAERMRADLDRRTRFEYAVLGYIPSPAP